MKEIRIMEREMKNDLATQQIIQKDKIRMKNTLVVRGNEVLINDQEI